jgi:hypothetical protein
MSSLNFEVRDTACQGPLGEYFVKYFYQEGIRQLTSGQLYLGRSSVSAEGALELADQAILEIHRDDIYSNKRLLPVASSVLRMCLGHEEPIIEVVGNIVVARDEKTVKILGNTTASVNTSSDPVTMFTRIGYEDGRPTAIAESNSLRVAYLPHASYSYTRNDHHGVVACRGLGTESSLIGLIGGEKVAIMAAAGDMQTD